MKVCPLTKISSPAPEICSLPGISSTWKEYSCTAMAQCYTRSGILGIYDWPGV